MTESWDTPVVVLNNSILDGKISMDIISYSLLKNPEGKKEVQIFNMKQMLLRRKEEVKFVGEMNLMEETKANPKVDINLVQEQ